MQVIKRTATPAADLKVHMWRVSDILPAGNCYPWEEMAPRLNRYSRILNQSRVRRASTTSKFTFLKRDDLRTIRTTTFGILQIFFLAHLIYDHVGWISRTSGPSMLPTISVEGDYVLISRYYKRGKGINVGDIVEFSHPMEPGAAALKRVVGMPGDFVMTGELGLRGGKRMIQVEKHRLVKCT